MDSDGLPVNRGQHSEPEVLTAQRREDPTVRSGLKKRLREPVCAAAAPLARAEQPTEAATCQESLPVKNENVLTHRSSMTIEEFVEHKFVPEHVARKGIACRVYYQAMLKHVLMPEVVDRVFQVNPANWKRRLRTIPDWPYLNSLRLRDARPHHIDCLLSAAQRRGYSTHTVTHIRNLVSVIFSYAKQEQFLVGDNPASQVKLPVSTPKEGRVLTLDQAKAALTVMNYPEKEMTMMAILTGMNISEIRGLQWKNVNLTENEITSDGDLIPPKAIAVRTLWYRCELGDVKNKRIRNVPIPQPLLQILLKLRQRANFTEPDNFVFASRVGGTVNVDNIMVRKFRPMAERLGVPSLSWRVLSRTRKSLTSELGNRFQDSMAMVACTASPRDASTDHKWRCRILTRQRQ